MKNPIRNKVPSEYFNSDIERRRKEYAEDEAYRVVVEKDYELNPKNMKYSDAFYRIGENVLLTKDTLLFPVKIVDGRKLFGKLQCLITPICSGEHTYFATPLGKRWVDRKFVILNHDHEYKQYKSYLVLKEDDT